MPILANINTIPSIVTLPGQGGGGIPPVTGEFIIIETSPYTGALVDYCHQENGVAPDEKIKIETAP
jgi:hypothetical protein